MAYEAAVRSRVADVMVTCPKTLGLHSSVDDLRGLFSDDQVHMALVVDPDGRLITTIERPDIPEAASNSAAVTEFGTLIKGTESRRVRTAIRSSLGPNWCRQYAVGADFTTGDTAP